MNRSTMWMGIAALAASGISTLFAHDVLPLTAALMVPAVDKAPDDAWTSEFAVDRAELAHTGSNPFFVLEPGYQLVLEGEGGTATITVLDETRMVDGVETRVVEERESEDGQLIEVSRNFFAISRKTNSVYYFGEEVDEYKNGKITGHSGAWLSGQKGAKCGLMMPGLPLLGSRFYMEVAPGDALDRATILSLREEMKTPAGQFARCLKLEETTPLEPDLKEIKHYAPGVGQIQDGKMKLVRAGSTKTKK